MIHVQALYIDGEIRDFFFNKQETFAAVKNKLTTFGQTVKVQVIK